MKTRLMSGLVLGGILILSGCSTDGMSSGGDMDHLKVDLPKQIEWVQTKNEKLGPNGNLQEWVIKGFKSNSTPARIVSQKISPAMPSKDLLAKVLQSFKAQCADVKVSKIPLNSKYPDKASVEVICSQLGKNPVGLMIYTSVFSGKDANYMVVGEVRIPPSKKAGMLDVKTKKQRSQVETSQKVAQLMQQMTINLQACDSGNTCK